MAYNKTAKSGNIFVLTEKGYENTPDKARPERKVGEPVRGFRKRVPVSWFEKGYVEEQRKSENNTIRDRRDAYVQRNGRT